MRIQARAFTLVELLVVIGIIAVLIAILLPTLGAARRQAAQVKCATQLREIYACFKQYETEYKGYWPVARVNGIRVGTTIRPYNVDGTDFLAPSAGSSQNQGYFFNFLAKYATKSKVGNTVGTALGAQIARTTIFYGCPSWEGYRNAVTAGDINTVQPGYGMNPYPSFTATYPGAGVAFPPTVAQNKPKEVAVLDPLNDGGITGNFLKAAAWTRPAERMLIADNKLWLAASNAAPRLPSYPPAVVAQPRVSNDSAGIGDALSSGGSQTLIDIYRHGKYPRLIGTNFDPRGGKIAYNILYADGHIGSPVDAKEAYRSFRMKFPG